MNEPKFKMIISYFTIRNLSPVSINGKNIYEYTSKSTKNKYYFKVSDSLVNNFRMDYETNSDIEKLMETLICIIRDERTCNLPKKVL